jgi:predicted XRE-type DNA-binding protein
VVGSDTAAQAVPFAESPAHEKTQAEAARRCGVTQPRIDDLLRGRLSRFSLEALVDIATALGCRVRVDLDAA